MDTERRGQTRNPSFTTAELVSDLGGDHEAVYPLMIGDRGPSGIGGVYMGQDALETDVVFTLREGSAEGLQVRLVWTKQVAKYVRLIGLEVVE